MHISEHRSRVPDTITCAQGRGVSWIRSIADRLQLATAAVRRGISWIRSARPSAAKTRSVALASVIVVTTGATVRPSSSGTLAVDSLDEVITNLRNVIVGLLIGLATLFATIGGVRYILAGGDPGEVEAAKRTLKYAAVGYSVAALAPLLVKILQSIVGVA